MGNGDYFSVIIPSRREGSRLLEAVREARALFGEGEVVVVTFEETGAIRDAVRAEGGMWLEAPRPGRGLQLRLGAECSRGRYLVFLHADTRLPADAGRLIRSALAIDGVAGGAFRLGFDRAHPVLDALAWLSRMTLRTAFLGDQCLFCTREAYEAAGGFSPEPLFEDVDLARRLARVGRLVRLSRTVTTSARRFGKNGPLRQLTLNALLLLGYHVGVSPKCLNVAYRPTDPGPSAIRRPGHGRTPHGTTHVRARDRRARRKCA